MLTRRNHARAGRGPRCGSSVIHAFKCPSFVTEKERQTFTFLRARLDVNQKKKKNERMNENTLINLQGRASMWTRGEPHLGIKEESAGSPRSAPAPARAPARRRFFFFTYPMPPSPRPSRSKAEDPHPANRAPKWPATIREGSTPRLHGAAAGGQGPASA